MTTIRYDVTPLADVIGQLRMLKAHHAEHPAISALLTAAIVHLTDYQATLPSQGQLVLRPPLRLIPPHGAPTQGGVSKHNTRGHRTR